MFGPAGPLAYPDDLDDSGMVEGWRDCRHRACPTCDECSAARRCLDQESPEGADLAYSGAAANPAAPGEERRR